MPRILVVDDSEDYRNLLRRHITAQYEDIEIVDYDPRAKGLPTYNFPWKKYDLVLLDYDLGLGKENGLGWMIHFSSVRDMPPVIMITSVGNTKVAVKALKAGAIDFIDKGDVSPESLKASIDEVFSIADRKNNLTSNIESVTPDDATVVTNIPLPELLFQDDDGQDFFDISNENNSLSESDDAQIKEFGILVPGYTLLKEIGRGGMSTVLLAKPIEDDTEVVLKVMFTQGHEDPLALKRFMQEYTLISCLNHQHIIKIYERAFASDFAYIAMEYFPGGDLSKRITAGLKEETALEYLRQMCLGLIALHDIKVVHRDIKPGNILFRDDETLTITDFGAAKNLTGDIEDITVNNQIVGTPYYMSPEQGTGMPIDHRSDLYSLGIMFYQMLTNERPYTARSVAQLISAHLNQPIPQLPEQLTKFQPLIDGLLAKDPDDRFQSANDLLIGIDWIK